MNRDHEQIAFGARRTKIADVSGVKQIKYAISEDDPASRAAMFLEHFVQTTTGKNFVARIHQELSIARQVCDAARKSITRDSGGKFISCGRKRRFPQLRENK